MIRTERTQHSAPPSIDRAESSMESRISATRHHFRPARKTGVRAGVFAGRYIDDDFDNF